MRGVFDNLDRRSVRVPGKELASTKLSADFRKAVKVAAANIREFARMQLPLSKNRTVAPGLRLGQVVRPLDSVAAYIPAGRYPLPSTIMMTVIPAQVAGSKTISICSPRAVPEVFGTAHLLGVENVFQMGGAHAIAAFAFERKTVPRPTGSSDPATFMSRLRRRYWREKSGSISSPVRPRSDHRRRRRRSMFRGRHAGAG
jgi:histidinol dehydrogenase